MLCVVRVADSDSCEDEEEDEEDGTPCCLVVFLCVRSDAHFIERESPGENRRW